MAHAAVLKILFIKPAQFVLLSAQNVVVNTPTARPGAIGTANLFSPSGELTMIAIRLLTQPRGAALAVVETAVDVFLKAHALLGAAGLAFFCVISFLCRLFGFGGIICVIDGLCEHIAQNAPTHTPQT